MMRTQFKSLLVLVVLGGAGLLWLYTTQSSNSSETIVKFSGSDALLAPENKSVLPNTGVAIPEQLLMSKSIKSTEERIRNRLVNHQFIFSNDQMFQQARTKELLFSTGVTPATAAQSPLANSHRLKDDRLWFSYDQNVLAARAEGDTFTLMIPSAGLVKAEIDRVDIVQGRYQWSGRILNQTDGKFYITQDFADQYAVGTIYTQQGEFQLESKSGIGWIAHSSSEFRLPPGGKDTLDPGDHKH